MQFRLTALKNITPMFATLPCRPDTQDCFLSKRSKGLESILFFTDTQLIKDCFGGRRKFRPI